MLRNKKIGPRSKAPIYVWVTAEEKVAIRDIAQQAHLPVSSYMRELALKKPPQSKVDKETLLIFRKMCADIAELCTKHEQLLETSSVTVTNDKALRTSLQAVARKQGELEVLTDELKRQLFSPSCPQQ